MQVFDPCNGLIRKGSFAIYLLFIFERILRLPFCFFIFALPIHDDGLGGGADGGDGDIQPI